MNSPALVVRKQSSAQSDLVDLTRQACLVAKDAVSHALDGLINGSPAALQAVRNCEEKLDDLDRELDERPAGNGQHFFRDYFGRRKKTSAQAGCGNHDLANSSRAHRESCSALDKRGECGALCDPCQDTLRAITQTSGQISLDEMRRFPQILGDECRV